MQGWRLICSAQCCAAQFLLLGIWQKIKILGIRTVFKLTTIQHLHKNSLSIADFFFFFFPSWCIIDNYESKKMKVFTVRVWNANKRQIPNNCCCALFRSLQLPKNWVKRESRQQQTYSCVQGKIEESWGRGASRIAARISWNFEIIFQSFMGRRCEYISACLSECLDSILARMTPTNERETLLNNRSPRWIIN